MPGLNVNISDALEKIRNSNEFLQQKQNDTTSALTEWLDKIKDWLIELRESFVEWLNSLFPSVKVGNTGIGDHIINIIAIVLIIIFVVVLVYTLFRLLEHYRKKEKEEFKSTINIITGTLDSKSWFDLAKNSALKGQHRDACRAIYMSLLLYLDENGIIKYDNAKTNMEYLQNVKSTEELYSPMKKVITVFEYLWYGKHSGTSSDYDLCLELYNKVTNE